MNYLTHQLLNAKEVNNFNKIFRNHEELWEDGRKTAGSFASKNKNNLQFNRNSEVSKKFSQIIKDKITSDPLIKSFALPKYIHGNMFTKSSRGMKYGRHLDNAFMSTGRADLSFTVFLNNKKDYGGGELIIENINAEHKFKLNQGEILIYPSSYLHEVSEITRGERLVFIGWIESYVKSTEVREYLFDMDAGSRSLLAKYGRSEDLDLIFKSYTNFLRLLGE